MTRLARGFTSIQVMGALAAMLIILITIVVWLRPTPKPVPPREQTSIDSLAATKPRFDTVRIESVRVETLMVSRSAQETRQSAIAGRMADSLHRVADELQHAAATAGESSERWFQVAETRKVENDSLRSANTALAFALTDQTTARMAADQRATAAEQRLAATTDLTERLKKDIAAGDRCRILYLVECPSRKVSTVAGIAAGTTIAFVFLRRR